MQRIRAQHLVARDDAEHGHAGEALALAVQVQAGRRVAEVLDHDHPGLAGGDAAITVIHAHAMLGLDQRVRQSDRHHQVELFVVRVERPDAAALGVELQHDAPQEAVAQRLDLVGLVEEGCHVVERADVAVLRRQLGRLLLHPLLQPGVQPLQLVGHAVEAARQHAEFVAAFHRQPGAELARRHALQTVAQAQHGRDDPQVQQIDHGQRAGAGDRRQHALRQPQHRGLAGVVLLDHAHQRVGLGHELRQRLQVVGGVGPAQGAHGRGLHDLAPVAGHLAPLLADAFVIGNEQRPRRIALGQPRDGLVHEQDLLVGAHLASFLRPHQLHRHPVGAHAQAAGIVDGRARAFQLPGQPQRPADHGQHHHQRGQRGGDDARGQAMPG